MTFAEFRQIVEQRGPVVRDGADWRGRCPAHADDGRRGDLTFREADGKVVLHCWGGCDGKSVVEALGLTWSDLFSENGQSRRPAAPRRERPKTVYPDLQHAVEAIGRRLHAEYVQDWTYKTADGRDALYVARFEGDSGKQYRPIHPQGGGYVEGDPPGKLRLYHLSDILKNKTGTVYACEGEKASDAGTSIGLLTTTSAHGAKSAGKTDWTPLAGRDVVILPDNDDDGERYSRDVTGILAGLNPPARVRIVRLPGLPPKGDLFDYVEARDAVEPAALRAQIEALAGRAQSEATAPRIVVCSAADWLVTEPPAPDQIVTDMFDRGDKVVLIGSSKVRKSFALLQLMESLAAGRDCLGWSVPRHRRVVGIQYEIQAHHFHRRVRRMATGLGFTPADLGDRLQIINARGQGLCGTAGIRAIAEAVRALEPEIITFDPLYKILEGKENAAEDVKATLALFDELAEETGAAIVYVHHDPKGFSGDRDIRDRGAGSNVLGRDYDACITMTPHASEADAAVVETLLRNYHPQEPVTIAWTEDPTTGGYCFATRADIAPTKQTSASSRKQNGTPFETLQAVALELLAAGPMPIADFKDQIKAKCGLGRNRTDELVRWLLLKADLSLDVYEARGKNKHEKYIGTTEQIARMRECNHA